MGLFEFLRQWQGGRMAGGVVLSAFLHLLVIALALWGPPPFPKVSVKPGEPLIVELPPAADSPPPGSPAPPRPAVASPPRPTAVPPAPPRRPAVAARPPTPRVAARPAEPVLERRLTTPPPAAAPDADATPAPVPKAADPVAAAPEAAPALPPTASAVEPEAVEPAEPAAPSAPSRVAALPPTPTARPMPDIRSLRRGGGGAGGSGEGRAGIEGEPIPLDSTDARYSDYLDQVRRRIKDKWGFPCVKNESTRACEYKTAQLIIEFGIAKNGKVPFITVLRSSGYAIYDDYAVNAVKLADFPPIPDTFSKTGVPIHATFSYVVQSSLTNILR
jgi:TonB family protein